MGNKTQLSTIKIKQKNQYLIENNFLKKEISTKVNSTKQCMDIIFTTMKIY